MLLTIVLRPVPVPAPPAPGVALTASATPPTGPDLQAVPAACADAVRGTPFASGTLEDRVIALRDWSATRPGAPVSLVVDDATVLAAVRAAAGAPNAPPFRDPDVRIRPDGIHLSGTASAAIFRYAIRATLVPEVAGGRFRLVVSALDTGGMPGFLRQQVSDAIARAADPTAWAIGLQVSEVLLRSGCGVIRGTAAD